MPFLFLQDLMVIFFLSAAVLFITRYLRLPTLVGLILTGVICGPHGLALIKGLEQVDILAQIGLFLLLFTVGMEFPLQKLWVLKKGFFLGGTLQVLLTCLCGFILAHYLGRPVGESIFLGFLLSMSSTAIVLKYLTDHFQENTLHGKFALSILIFQDLITIPILLFVPIMAGKEMVELSILGTLLLKSIALILFVMAFGSLVMPQILSRISVTAHREMFLLLILGVCFLMAWLAALIGLPPTLGAFLAGLILAESDYHYQVVGNILPLQDILISLFFVSIGMLVDISFFITHPFIILLVSLAVLIMKASVMTLTGWVLNMPLRITVLTAISLSQIGEFAFVLAKEGMLNGIGTAHYYQLFLAVSIITMVMTPVLLELAPFLADKLLSKNREKSKPSDTENRNNKENHVIIIGYGISGHYLSNSCKLANIPYDILEINSTLVKQAKLNGEPIYFGDATHAVVLKQVDIEKAKAIVIVINDLEATKRIIFTVRNYNPQAYVIVRCSHLTEAKELMKLGASEVVAADVEASITICSLLLETSELEDEHILNLKQTIRKDVYQNLQKGPRSLLQRF